MKNLFIIDPLEEISQKLLKDSSTLLMETGLSRGHEIFIATVHDLFLSSGSLKIKCKKVLAIDVDERSSHYGYTLDDSREFHGNDFQVIWLRKNPPFDETYLMHLMIFDQLSKSHPEILFINSPESIRAVNEKMCIFEFPDFIAESIVTMNLEEIHNFWLNHKKIVVKGLTGFGGDSVILIENWEQDLGKLVELSKDGKRFLMAQKFLENIYSGDKRMTIVNGEVLGVFSRVPAEDSFIAYTGAGATVHLATLTEREEEIAHHVGQFLRKHQIFFAGVDLIDGKLVEINITSPSFFALINRQKKLGMDLKIWEMIEQKVAAE